MIAKDKKLQKLMDNLMDYCHEKGYALIAGATEMNEEDDYVYVCNGYFLYINVLFGLIGKGIQEADNPCYLEHLAKYLGQAAKEFKSGKKALH